MITVSLEKPNGAPEDWARYIVRKDGVRVGCFKDEAKATEVVLEMQASEEPRGQNRMSDVKTSRDPERGWF
jgi:hypothetical protein